MLPPRSHSRRLRVEGPDDLHTIIALLTRHGADFRTPDLRLPHVSDEPPGVDAALAAIEPGVKTYERFGIVIDSELPGPESPNRWLQVRDRMRRVGLLLPDAQPADGLVINGLRPGHRVGLWLMPDNVQRGTLEHLVATLVPPADPAIAIAQDATDRALSAGAPLHERDRLKGVLHAWLAWQEPPGRPFGGGVTAGAFRSDSPMALVFVEWFRRLFDAP